MPADLKAWLDEPLYVTENEFPTIGKPVETSLKDTPVLKERFFMK
jgi:hypothetical protein